MIVNIHTDHTGMLVLHARPIPQERVWLHVIHQFVQGRCIVTGYFQIHWVILHIYLGCVEKA